MAGFALLLGCCSNSPSPIDHVNTMTGTSAAETANADMHGRGTEVLAQTIPAVLVPHGMNFWTPQTRHTETKCVSPYYYSDDRMQGFRASHWMDGSCTQDYGSATVMMVTGSLCTGPRERASAFSHDREVSTPAYYAVDWDDYGIRAEMTGTGRAALMRFTFAADGDAWLLVEPNSDEGESTVVIDAAAGTVRTENPVHRIYQGRGERAGFSGHSIVTVEKKTDGYGVWSGDERQDGIASIAGKPEAGGWLRFRVRAGETITVRMATSFTGPEGASANMLAEIPDYDFDRVRRSTEAIWNDALGAITVETRDEVAKRKFYTALYHSLFLPHDVSDADGGHPAFSTGLAGGIIRSEGGYYDDFSAWDTYRAIHPLLNIIAPKTSAAMVRSLVEKYRQGGWLPIFPCWNSYTAAMIGDHTTAIIADAWVKGVRDFDMAEAYRAMRKNAFESPATIEEYRDGMGRRALESYRRYGYIPLEDQVPDAFHRREQVSRTLEYAYDDFALAQVARDLGMTDDEKELRRRAQNYRNVIDPATGWARGRHADGRFIEQFDPFKLVSFITEGYPCHYTFYVPQDVPGLIESTGGRERFIEKLDTLFTRNLYWHGNEPCHQVAFLYNQAGQPWKTQRQVRRIMLDEYADGPGGLSGNDDCGQMSAWYVFAAMGFYPVCPATPYYQIASPSFDRMSIRLPEGKKFTIKTVGGSEDNVYIGSVTRNGEPYHKSYIAHSDILDGAEFEFTMSPEPVTEWASSPESYTLPQQ